MKYDSLEISRTIGQPLDPRKPYSELITQIANVEQANPDEDVFYYDVLLETDKTYTTVANGVTQTAVTIDTPTQFTFIDVASPEYYVKLTDLATNKEAPLARKLKTIDRSLTAYENYYVLDLMNTATVGNGQVESLTSGTTHFTYENLIDMMDNVIDYGDNFTLVVGTLIDKDIKLWNWKDDKNQSLAVAFGDLNISRTRINQTVTINDASTNVLASTDAFLVAKNTEVQLPILFVRKKLNDIKILNGVISDSGEKPERLIFVSPNPITVTGSARYLAVGLTGYENIVSAVINYKGLFKFIRS